MKRLVLCLCVLLILPALAQQRPRQRRQENVKVTLQVVDQKRGGTSSQTSDLLELKVKLVNTGEVPVTYSNNKFVLIYDNGHDQPVNRLRYPERGTLDPGKSVIVERIFFDVPKGEKPSKVAFVVGLRQVATVNL